MVGQEIEAAKELICPATLRRSRLEVYLDVLRVIDGGTHKPTQIMYKANTSWVPLQRILGSMGSKGFIREVNARGDRDGRTRRLYEITQKGQNVIRYLSHAGYLLEFMEVANIRVT